MRTPKTKQMISEASEMETGSDRLSAEEQLAELLRMNNAIDDQEIEKRLQDLSGIQRTPEEVKEKELTEAFIKAKEKKIEECRNRIEAIRQKDRNNFLGVKEEEWEEARQLRSKIENLQNEIENDVRKIRNDISPTKSKNAEAVNDHKWELMECANNIARLEKTMKLCETEGKLDDYEQIRQQYFSEKARLKELEKNQPKILDERPDILREEAELKKAIRKNLCLKMLFHLEEIKKEVIKAETAELNAVEAADEISWRHYKDFKNRWSHEAESRAYYAALKDEGGIIHLKEALSQMK